MQKDISFEKEHLKQTKLLAHNQIALLEEAAEKKKEDIKVQKQQMREETKHSMSANLWGSEGFEQLVELSQFASQTSESISKYESYINKIEQLKRFIKCPYFARIDFRLEDEEETEQVYIGRYSVMDEENYNMVVYDWRSPISSMFYRFGLGKAFYEAPMGNINGEINLKRQYEIKSGKLEYFFDTDIQILDEFLKKMLSQNASPQMKSIVETIQRDQDIIIRNKKCDLLMVQGVAGSGKTSIALHRVSYLMYHGLTNKLSSNNIIIISPNLLFEQYISNVLPELGEENITSFLFDEIFEIILKRKFQTKNELYELIITNPNKYLVKTIKESLLFKMKSEFIKVLKTLNIPSNLSLEDILAIYTKAFNNEDNLKQLKQNNSLPESFKNIQLFTQENLDNNNLYYDDASALVYLYLRSNKLEDYIHIKQVVIDEAQDYYPIHFEILNLLFPNARFTILGDINQTIEKQEKISFYDEVKNILNKKRPSLVSMDKSFRCAHEIFEFSSRLLNTEVKSFSRHCDKPQIYKRESETDYASLLKEINVCKENGYQSIGIICKSAKETLKLFENIKEKIEVNIIQGQSGYDLIGTFILPVYLSKGLEFDAALIWDVDSSHYNTLEDKQLLYIACTRALHRLNLFYYGDISLLLK